MEEAVEEAYKKEKKLRYANLANELEDRDWKVFVCAHHIFKATSCCLSVLVRHIIFMILQLFLTEYDDHDEDYRRTI